MGVGDRVFQELVEQHTFLDNAGVVLQVKRCSWGKAYEIDLIAVEAALTLKLQRKQRHTGRQRHRAVGCGVYVSDAKPVYILPRYDLIRADIYDVDSIDFRPQMLKCLGNDTF